MWYRFILISSLINGFAIFGPRVIEGWGLNEHFRMHYLTLWYGGGAVMALLYMIKSKLRPTRVEMIAGLIMGVLSLLGLSSTLRALQGLPGNVVYSSITAGEITSVSIIGTLAFKEKLGPCGIAGVISGMLAVILLTLK